VGARPGTQASAALVTQVQNVASTASVANSSIDADCRLERSETANRTARLIASLVTGSAYSWVMTISLLHQSHGNQADGCSFTWDYSAASARGVTPVFRSFARYQNWHAIFLWPMPPSAARFSVAVSAHCWNSMTLDVACATTRRRSICFDLGNDAPVRNCPATSSGLRCSIQDWARCLPTS
jgi:hypothetical protein